MKKVTSQLQSPLNLNEAFNNFFDVFGDELMFINNMKEIRKVCPNFKRIKKPKKVKETKNVERCEQKIFI
jgi:sensor histidine kinase regulating citrate/malate metabolism